MDYAVVKTGGKQYKVSPGDIIEVDRMKLQPKEKAVLSDVLLLVTEGKVTLGKPIIKGAEVNGIVLEHFRGEKIRVAKFKAKVRYRRVIGHRQDLTRVKIGEFKKS